MATKAKIATPALLVDLDALEENVARLAGRVRAAGKKLRPHFKAHKCLEIAKRQIAAGAVGICAATVDEVEVLSRAGVTGVLLTSPVADLGKMRRVAASGAMAVVDHARQVEWYAAAARSEGREIGLFIDFDVGDHRTGAASLEQALAIAGAIRDSKWLRLEGLQAYSVSGSHGADFAARKQISEAAFAAAARVKEALGVEILSGGSTGTWDVDLALPQVTELQAGSYVLMDLAYRKIGIEFRQASAVLATVVSENHAGFVTVDAGFKAFSTDRAFGPEPMHAAAAGYRWGGDEFGYVDLKDGAKLELGDQVEFVPPHCDPTVNLYERIYACRGGVVEAVWGVMAGLV